MKPSAYEFVAEWKRSFAGGDFAECWDTFKTRKEATARLRKAAADHADAFDFRIVEKWSRAQAVEAK